ncbi:hypothetical protein ACHAXA_001026 [Cyclostephanos tholiformis]|uniref:Ricin B lectin domain-containing protein n=1 Tax=Cyclostephanos tholiformis TaxID=382380 RepID=A0ABD3RW41_9STRA
MGLELEAHDLFLPFRRSPPQRPRYHGECYCTYLHKSGSKRTMRLLIIIPTAAVCSIRLSALAEEHSARSRKMGSNRNRRRRMRRQQIIFDEALVGQNSTRGLNIYDDDGGRNNRNHYTKRPTRKPTRGATRRPTRRPTAITPPSTSQSTFRLKLYWQEGFYWQGNDEDPVYCMECSSSNDCKVGNEIIIKHCSSARDQKFTEVGGTIRPAMDTTLCFTVMGYGRAEDNDGDPITEPIQLQSCDGDNSNQKFVGFRNSGRFELGPIGHTDRCLGQAHHPKSYEMIHPKSCATGRIDTTSYWITY